MPAFDTLVIAAFSGGSQAGLLMGKQLTGLSADHLARDPKEFGSRVCFLHTGGIFSLFPFRDALSRLLDGDPLLDS